MSTPITNPPGNGTGNPTSTATSSSVFVLKQQQENQSSKKKESTNDGSATDATKEESFNKIGISSDLSPEASANFFSKILYTWLDPLFLKGYRRPLQMSDIWRLGPEWQVENLSKTLETAWENHLAEFEKQKQLEKSQVDGDVSSNALASGPSTAELVKSTQQKRKSKKQLPDKPSLMTATWNALFWKLMPYGFLRLFSSMATIASPLLIKFLVDYVTRAKIAYANDTPGPSIGEGFGLAVGIFALQMAATIGENYYFQLSMTSGMAARAAFTSIIYKKSMRLSASARQKFNAGNVTNLVSTDVARMEQFFGYMHTIWVAPVQILVILALLISQIGPSALAGVGLLIIIGPFQGMIMRSMALIRKSIAPLTDKRVKLTQEVFSGIRVIKFFTWETPFLELIENIRKEEVGQVLRRTTLNAFVMTVAFAVPALAAAIAFAIYGATSTLDPGRVFSSLTWFGILRFPLMFLPMLISSLADVKVAFSRITDLLLAPEVSDPPVIVESAPFAIQVKNGFFEWDTLPEDPKTPDAKKIKAEKKKSESKTGDKTEGKKQDVSPSTDETSKDDGEKTVVADSTETAGRLTDINLAIPKGKLVAIVGTVGAGKSSLLNALVGEMKKVSGDVTFSGSTGYAPQQAWIQNATVKENILFGLPFDEKRYAAAIRDCALEKDLAILPDGDQTQIGERGINLSGGQKQRINLARLVYFNSSIVFLDDPLSAVDSHVGRHLFEQCIQGALKGKTRVLVTHQLHFLPKVDIVIVMKAGKIEELGTYEELMAKQGEFAELMRNYGGADDEDKESKEDVIEIQDDAHPKLTDLGTSHEEKKIVETSDTKKDETTDVKDKKTPRKLMQEEERAVGSVAGNVWWAYFKAAGGWPFIFVCVFMSLLSQAARVGNDYWLVTWSNKSIPGLSQGAYIGIYLSWGILQSLLTYIWGVLFAYYGVRAARVTHEKAISNLIRAPVRFFDTTPLGRIINRFSKDQDAMDTTLMDSLRMFLNTLASSIAIFALVCFATPFFAVPMIPIMAFYYFVQVVYRSTSRELKRLDSISRSPLYAQIGETLTGLPTIRAYREESRFINVNNTMINGNNAPYFLLLSAARWLSIRLETLGALLVFFAATFGILSRENANFTASLLGLSLSYVLQVTNTLNWCVRQYTETEIAMNAVERVQHYAKHVEQEPPAIVEGKRPSSSWPEKGDVVFEKVDMRYAPDLPLVLKSVSFSIKDKEKIGIVGRTGSGKSSLMQVLFRMVEPAGGKIIVDGLSILEMGVQDLRSKLGIIPQDPILFSGTFRRNLDPFNQYSDQQLWDALERANIKPRVVEAEGGLDGVVTEGGDNLSVGQRQLICLARAMLRHARVLVMDEATANVDYETDAIIQKCLREDFADSTILTIAHRLNTIIDYDRVMVMDQGNLVEFDSPKALLSNPKSIFFSMVKETGQQNMELFFKMLELEIPTQESD